MALVGPPKDVEGQCNVRLEIADDFGDNHATMRCQREPNHEGKHREVYQSKQAGEVTVEWERDGRVPNDLGEYEDELFDDT
jgi:hypothetical protein